MVKLLLGTFTRQDTLPIEEAATTIGVSRLSNGAISALEMYVDAGRRLPDALKNLIISSQMIRNRNEDPLRKKKKVY